VAVRLHLLQERYNFFLELGVLLEVIRDLTVLVLDLLVESLDFVIPLSNFVLEFATNFILGLLQLLHHILLGQQLINLCLCVLQIFFHFQLLHRQLLCKCYSITILL